MHQTSLYAIDRQLPRGLAGLYLAAFDFLLSLAYFSTLQTFQGHFSASAAGGETSQMIIEQRIYTLKPGKTGPYLLLYQEKGLVIQTHHLGRLVGYFTSEYGALNQIIHLWAYEDLADRTRRRAALFADKRWVDVVEVLYGMIDRMENMILAPTAFSPLR